MLAVMVPMMMEMKIVIRTRFRNGSARVVPKILSQNSNGKRRSGCSLSISCLSVTGDKVREILTKHLSLITVEDRIPLL